MENSSSIRRRTSRTTRETTPDPNRTEKISKVLEQDFSKNRSIETDSNETRYVVKGILNVGPPSPVGSISSSSSGSGPNSSGSHAYRAKILSKKEKSMAQAVHRSQSSSRQSASCQTNNDIFTYLRRAKRSLSAPRKREGSVESVKLTPQMQEMKISLLEKENYELSNKSNGNDEKNVLLEHNLKRFEEERRQFEMEKLKFLEDKRELDRLRLQRFERYKRELEAKRLGIRPNYDIDNPNDYMVARKIIIDYKVNENLHSQEAQESGSESEQEITVVENLQTSVNENKSKECQNDNEEIVCKNDKNDNEIGECSKNVQQIAQSHLNGKEMLNGVEKSNDRIVPEIERKNKDNKEYEKNDFDDIIPMHFWPLCMLLYNEFRHIWKEHKKLYSSEWHHILYELKKCISELLMLMMLCGTGGIILHYIEGNFEMLNKTGVKRVKRDFIDQLWLSSHNLREEDWKSMARIRLRKFEEELQAAIEGGMITYSGHTTWNFVNAVLYCLDISTTIGKPKNAEACGYGHISPRTVSGRIVTIVYAIIGIPIFLILLADFGKLFTRIIKFLWVFVRRLYYTGSCRKVRKTAPAQDMMRGLNAMYDIMKRPSLAFDPNVMRTFQQQQENSRGGPPGESPMTPLPENLKNYEIDDEFNLPISVAIIMLVGYMIFGAAIYCILEEDWTFFESFYFVFISISTIGFGDFVPSHPLYMMASILYLIFGLALTSMCINVVQVKLSDHFKQASSKIIGLHFAEAASQGSVPQSAELQSIQSTNLNENSQPTNVIIADKNTKNTNSTML
ncbi:unnamed protein product [Chironomus riparius]|uniref:Potassium channel domain-containing protein n=1 Tax=Chironomus riparius TaxID=315576 RepID=A0A9N9RQP4_9DIPT|nr:unnamed protein product [Chironomus riparius]